MFQSTNQKMYGFSSSFSSFQLPLHGENEPWTFDPQQHPPLEQRDTPHPGVGSAAASRPGVRGEPMAIILGA